jgi:hypothetical protein
MSASGWTVDTLKAHYDALRLADQAAIGAALEAQKEAVRAALAAAEKASEKTETALKEYKSSANEWRGTINDILSKTGGAKAGGRELWGYIAGALGLLLALASFAVRFIPTSPRP